MEELRALIKDVPDFPKPGIIFKDFTPLLADPAGLALAVELMVNPFRGRHIDVVIGAESRGFIFGIAVAQALAAGFVPVRKRNKLPREVFKVEYLLEYGQDQLEVHVDALRAGQRVLLVDDLLATGGTMVGCRDLINRFGVEIVGVSVLIELEALGGRARLGGVGDIRSVLPYS